MTSTIVRNKRFKKMVGLGEYLPDTILESKYKKEYSDVVKAIISEKVEQ